MDIREGDILKLGMIDNEWILSINIKYLTSLLLGIETRRN